MLDRNKGYGVSNIAKLAEVSKLLFAVLVWFFYLIFASVRLKPTFNFWRIVGQATTRTAEMLGPAYVKFAQILSTRLNELPRGLTLELSRLQDQVRPQPYKAICSVIESALSTPLDSVFSSFSKTPLAAGSVAQVHRATLKDGREVAVKIRRSNAFRSANRTMALFRFFVHTASGLPYFKNVPALESFEEISEALLGQFDFIEEVRMNERLQRMFAGRPGVRIPKVIPQLSSDSMIVMEFIPDLQKVTDDATDSEWLTSAIRVGFKALYDMILRHGVIHCDFHAGNIFFSPGPQVTILDTGFMKLMRENEVFEFRNFFIGIFLGDGVACSEILLRTASHVSPTLCVATFRSRICQLIERHSRTSAAEFHVTRFAEGIFRIQRECGVRGAHAFTMAILALLMYEGIAAKFSPELDFQAEALDIIGPIIIRRGIQ